jgi:plasmid stabilization system protein ParE
MIEPLAVELTTLAAQQIREAEQWWRFNRPAAPNAIREELQRLLPIIAIQPRIGSRVTNVRLEGVRRIHIPRIRYHLYFHVTGIPEFVEVVAFWHSSRGSGPPI